MTQQERQADSGVRIIRTLGNVDEKLMSIEQ